MDWNVRDDQIDTNGMEKDTPKSISIAKEAACENGLDRVAVYRLRTLDNWEKKRTWTINTG